MKKLNNIICLYEAKNQLGESPVWVDELNTIFWVDILESKICSYQIYEKNFKEFEVPEKIGFIIHIKKFEFIGGLSSGLYYIDLTNKIFNKIPGANIKNKKLRINDGKCDALGNLWFGTIDDTKKIKGNLYFYKNNSSIICKSSNFITPNGPTFSPDNKTIYFTDSCKKEIYSSVLKENNLKDKKIFMKFPKKFGSPDGMTIDEEGFLWVAFYGDYCVRRISPKGDIVMKIDLPVSNITSCAFGGKNLETLFITSAKKDLKESELFEQKLAGSIFCVNTGYKGIIQKKFIM